MKKHYIFAHRTRLPEAPELPDVPEIPVVLAYRCISGGFEISTGQFPQQLNDTECVIYYNLNGQYINNGVNNEYICDNVEITSNLRLLQSRCSYFKRWNNNG